MPLRLPDAITTCLFDLDGVLTRTAEVHAAAWKQMFDEYLQERSARTGVPFVPFNAVDDYDAYVDGRPRVEGTRTFLSARGIQLPDGDPEDPPGTKTIQGLSNRKNEIFLQMLQTEGVHIYPGSIRFVRAVRDVGHRTAVVSSSANTLEVLEAAKIADLFDARVDAGVAAERHLAGKPAPDTYLAAADLLGVEPAHASVFEDAQAGVAAGRAGGFGLVVGVDRAHQADALKRNGADIVVDDLEELLN